MKKIAIIGYGFVGKAVDFGFSKNVIKTIIDPKLRTSTKDILKILILYLLLFLHQ